MEFHFFWSWKVMEFEDPKRVWTVTGRYLIVANTVYDAMWLFNVSRTQANYHSCRIGYEQMKWMPNDS